MHRLIPGSELRIFEESAHSIGDDQPQLLQAAIAEFLATRLRQADSIIQPIAGELK